MDCNPPGFSVHGISQARILYHYATRKVPYVSLSSLNFVHLFFTDFLFLVWFIGKESMCQCRRLGFNPWVGKNPWRREWQPTPVFLAGKFHGQRSLVGYSPWGQKESNMTEHMRTHVLATWRCTLGLQFAAERQEWWAGKWGKQANPGREVQAAADLQGDSFCSIIYMQVSEALD